MLRVRLPPQVSMTDNREVTMMNIWPDAFTLKMHYERHRKNMLTHGVYDVVYAVYPGWRTYHIFAEYDMVCANVLYKSLCGISIFLTPEGIISEVEEVLQLTGVPCCKRCKSIMDSRREREEEHNT